MLGRDAAPGPDISPAFVMRWFIECAMSGFRDRATRRRSRHYAEHWDRVKTTHGVLLGRRNRMLVRYSGWC